MSNESVSANDGQCPMSEADILVAMVLQDLAANIRHYAYTANRLTSLLANEVLEKQFGRTTRPEEKTYEIASEHARDIVFLASEIYDRTDPLSRMAQELFDIAAAMYPAPLD